MSGLEMAGSMSILTVLIRPSKVKRTAVFDASRESLVASYSSMVSSAAFRPRIS